MQFAFFGGIYNNSLALDAAINDARRRGADAMYAAVAHQVGSTLISRDNEHLTRLNGIITVRTPEAAHRDLTPHSETSPILSPCGPH